MDKILKRFEVLRKKVAALGVCPKCGYGFAGNKPSPSGMVKLSPSDPTYSPKEPCPGCGMTQLSTKGDEAKESGFGEKYYVHDRTSDYGFVGPFYSHSDAEGMFNELSDLHKELDKWAGWYDGRPFIGNVVTEDQMYAVSVSAAKKRVDFAKEKGMDPETIAAWNNSKPTITSPSTARSSEKANIEYLKEQYFERQNEDLEPNVASVLQAARLQVKYAQKVLDFQQQKKNREKDTKERNQEVLRNLGKQSPVQKENEQEAYISDEDEAQNEFNKEFQDTSTMIDNFSNSILNLVDESKKDHADGLIEELIHAARELGYMDAQADNS